MRRIISLFVAAIMLLTLSACGGDEGLGVSPTPAIMQTDATPTAAPVSSWKSQGRAYKQSLLTDYADSMVSVFAHGGDYYQAIMYWDEIGKEMYEIIKNGQDVIYAPKNVYIRCANGGDNGIWIVENEKIEDGYDEHLRLISYSGEVLLTVSLEDLGLGDAFIYTLRCSEDDVYLRSPDMVALVDGSGALKSTIAIESDNTAIVTGGDGQVYLASVTETGVEISLIEAGGLSPVLSAPIADARLCGGNEEFLFTYFLDDGLYGLDVEGNSTPIIIWEDCRITVANYRGIISIPDEAFLLLDYMGASILSPVDPSEMSEAVPLP